MYYQNFIKVGIGTSEIKVANPKYNASKIIESLNQSKASIVLFSELNLSSLYAGDLFFQPQFLNDNLEALDHILKTTTYQGFFTIGLPLRVKGNIYNAVLAVANRKIIGATLKVNLTKRDQLYFSDFKNAPKSMKLLNQEIPVGINLYQFNDLSIGIEIGHDERFVTPISDLLVVSGANVILNPSNDPELLNSGDYKYRRVLELSRRHKGAYIYCSPASSESTSEYVYAGDMVAALDGAIVAEGSNLYDSIDYLEFDIDLNHIYYQKTISKNFKVNSQQDKVIHFEIPMSKEYIFEEFDQMPFFENGEIFESCNVINQLLKQALTKKLLSLPPHLRKIIIGVSGGADSTLALLIAEQVLEELKLDPSNLIAVCLPSVNTSQESLTRALHLISGVNAKQYLISIDEQLAVHLKSINHQKKDVTYENAQARIRTNILMDLANKHGGIVIGPSDLSEIALGFTTYNGDASSMYGLNQGIPKTIVLEMLKFFADQVYIDLADVIKDIANTPPSPELLKDQVTEEVLGKYLINDFILYHFIKSGWDEKTFKLVLPQAFELTAKEATSYIDNFFKRFYANQFKRSVLPEGPNVLGISLNPHDGFRLPGDNEVE